jgi:hypothetical protein
MKRSAPERLLRILSNTASIGGTYFFLQHANTVFGYSVPIAVRDRISEGVQVARAIFANYIV